QRLRGARAPRRSRAGPDDAEMQRVSERGADRGAPVRVLHLGAGLGRHFERMRKPPLCAVSCSFGPPPLTDPLTSRRPKSDDRIATGKSEETCMWWPRASTANLLAAGIASSTVPLCVAIRLSCGKDAKSMFA